jgi:predicted nucleic acid-binding protein
MRRVYLDACIVIYLLEDTAPFSEKTRQFFARNSDAHLCVSPLVRMEALLKPLRESATTLVADYEDFLAAQHWLTIDDSIFNRALHLRAHHGLKTPDSLHLATALHHGCNEFWTNDDRLNKAAGILAVNVFSDE